MKYLKQTLLLTLILWSVQLNAQFNLEELKQIRNYQIKAFYCDSLLENRALKIKQQDQIIQSQNNLILNHRQKSTIQEEEIVYYRELIRGRDKIIDRLKKQNKGLKIGFISFGISSAVLLGYLAVGR